MENTICQCGHWFEEHNDDACSGCDAAGFDISLIDHKFSYDEEASSPDSIANRGGDPALWPQYVKDYFND